MIAAMLPLLLVTLAESSSAFAVPTRPGLVLKIDEATTLTSGTPMLPPMVSVPCSGGPIHEMVKPPNVDDLYEWYVSIRKEPDADPSWGVLWPTAVSLAEFLLGNPELVRGKKVVELGAGFGLCGLIAAGLGASAVVLTDREPFALHCALSTAQVNNLSTVQGAIVDWCDDTSMVDSADVILASDVLYDGETIEAFVSTCQRMLKKGGIVLVTDPIKERYKGARDKFIEACLPDATIDFIELPSIPEDDDWQFHTADGKDHARRMKEPTALLRCSL